MYLVLLIAAFLDPHFKTKCLEFCLSDLKATIFRKNFANYIMVEVQSDNNQCLNVLTEYCESMQSMHEL